MQRQRIGQHIGAKRKFEFVNNDYQKRVQAAWQSCRLPAYPKTNCSGDDLNPGFNTSVHETGDKLLPTVLINMILEYCTPSKLYATAQQFDLAQLCSILKLTLFNEPFGLVKLSRDHLWIAAQDSLGHQTFKVPLLDGGNVSSSHGQLTQPDITDYTRCGTGFFCNRNGPKLISLENGDQLAQCESSRGEWKICRLYACNAEWMVACISQNYLQQFVINRKTEGRVLLGRNFYHYPDNVILCQPQHNPYPWVLVFYHSTFSATQNSLQIFESHRGTCITTMHNPGKLLYIGDDQRSITCIATQQVSPVMQSFVTRYNLPLCTLHSRTLLKTCTLDLHKPYKGPTFVLNTLQSEPQEHAAHQRVLLGIHPIYDKSLELVHNTEQVYVQQSIADPEGNYLAAIIHYPTKNRTHLVVWHITSE